MVDITIPELLDGTNTRKATSLVMFDEGGTSFNGTSRPNSSRQINVTNQASLENQLGTNLEIPDGTALTIVVDESFTLTKPFKIGLTSFIEIYASAIRTILTYTGSGALFQNLGPANDIRSCLPHNIILAGDGTNSVFDIKGDALSALDANNVNFINFDSMGTADMAFVIFTSCATQTLNKGLIALNPQAVTIGKLLVNQTGPTGITFLTIKTNIPTNVDIDTLRALSFFSGDSLLFFDPNAPIDTIYTLRKCEVAAGDLYQRGTDIVINSVADNGSGKARFTAAASHGLSVGTPVVLTDFTAQPTYEGTFIVTAVDTPLTGTTFDVEEITFVGTSTGAMNRTGLDQTNPPVIASNNKDSNDSMSSAQVGFTNIAAPIVVVISTQDVPVIIGGSQFASDNIERASTTGDGQITNLTKKTQKYPITFSGLVEKVGGGSTDIGLLLLKNGNPVLTDTFQLPHSVNAGIIQVSATRDFELAETDTLDIAVVNFAGTANISVSQANVSYSVKA